MDRLVDELALNNVRCYRLGVQVRCTFVKTQSRHSQVDGKADEEALSSPHCYRLGQLYICQATDTQWVLGR